MATRDGIIIREELNIILLVDNSYSMVNLRIAQVNSTIPKLLNSLKQVAEDENVDLKLRIISFSDEAVWEVGSPQQGVDIASVTWNDLDVVGGTSTSKAIREANKALKKEYFGAHALRPVVILVTDGNCTDAKSDYLASIEEMKKCLARNTGKERVIRVAIGVDDYNREELVEFASEGIISNVAQPLIFEIDKAADVTNVINWVVVASVISSITAVGDNPPDLGQPDWEKDEEEVYEPYELNWDD